MSKDFRPYAPDQSELLPPSPRDWLSPEHVAYFILDTVAVLELSALMARYERELRGYPPHHPRMMVAVLRYAYCVGIASSRKIERKTYEDIAFRVIAAGQHPDHTTISEFRRKHLDLLAGLFVQVLALCQKAGLVKLGHVALDGTKLKANASKRKAMVHQAGSDIAGAPGAARGAHAASLAREGHQQFVAAAGTADAREAVREHAAAEVVLELACDEGGEPPARKRLPHEVRERAADGRVKGSLLGSARTIRGRQRRGRRAIPSLVHVPRARTRICPPSRHSPPTEGPRCRPPAGLLRGRGPIPADRWTRVRNRAVISGRRFRPGALRARQCVPRR